MKKTGLLYLIFTVYVFYLLSCASGSPVPYGDETLHISALQKELYAGGDQTIIKLSMYKSDGMPVLDNTKVELSATAGYFGSDIVTLIDGKGETTYFTDSFVGEVTISASSGKVGAGGNVSTVINVLEADNTPATVAITTSPSTVYQKGDVIKVHIYCYNSVGKPLKNIPVFLSSDFGILTSNGNLISTDSSGKAEDQLIINNSPAGVEAINLNANCLGVTAETKLNVVNNKPPEADFTYSPSNPQLNNEIYFYSKASDSDGSIDSYLWRFGDGTTDTNINAVHRYSVPGDYTVSLTVTDSGGSSVIVEKTITITSGEIPVAAFTYTPDPIRAGDSITFDASISYDSDGTIEEYKWNFGTGFVRDGMQTTWTFPSAGQASVTLKITDNSGNVVLLTKEITVVGNIAPVANFDFAPLNPHVNDNVNFNADTSSDEDGTVVSYKWNFGDGFTSNVKNPQHIYKAKGEYNVVLTVKDNDNAFGTVTKTLTVSDNQLPVANFFYTPQSPEENTLIYFDGTQSKDEDGTIVSYTWNFGDGTYGYGATPTHVYKEKGSYVVLLKVKDNVGGEGFLQQTISVAKSSSTPPNIQLNVSPSTITTDTAEVLLDASGTTDDTTSLLGLSFTYEITPVDTTGGSNLTLQLVDTGASSIKRLLISGSNTGDFINVFLTVIDGDGQYSTKSVTLEIK